MNVKATVAVGEEAFGTEQRRQAAGLFTRAHQVGKGQMPGMGIGHPVKHPGGFIERHDLAAVGLGQQHGHGIAVEQQPVAGLALHQSVKRHGAVNGIADTAHQRLAVHQALDQVVGGADLHGPQVKVVVTLPCQQDQGGIDAFLPGLSNELDAGLRPQPIVHQGHVVAICPQRPQAVIGIVHPVELERHGATFVEQVAGNQHVVFVILNQQDAQAGLISHRSSIVLVGWWSGSSTGSVTG